MAKAAKAVAVIHDEAESSSGNAKPEGEAAANSSVATAMPSDGWRNR